MDGMLSQDEINALLNGMSADDSADNETSETPQESNESASDNTPNTDKPEALSDTEKDAVGEISNISMGTAATTLSSLLNQKVNITTPRVEWNSKESLKGLRIKKVLERYLCSYLLILRKMLHQQG